MGVLFDLIREQVTARQAAEFYSMSINRYGKALCPWHDDHKPSLSFDPRTGRCKCFSCNRGGGAVDLVAALLGCSPSLRQSSELFRKVREGYSRVSDPPKLTEDNKLSLTMTNGSRIVSLPGDPATVRGYSGVTLFLEDEASQVSDEFYGAILPMLMIGNGQLILMSTPFGKRGHFYDEWANGGNGWVRHAITAKECPRMTETQLEQQWRSMGDMFFRQEFECEFVDTVEQTFSYDSIQRAFSDEVEPLPL